MKQLVFVGYSLSTALLLSAAWPMMPFTFLIFAAFVPLLILAEKNIQQKQYFLYCFIATLGWNATTTWWIWNSTDVGSVAAIVANSILMCLPLCAYFSIRKKVTINIAYIAFITFWMLFEYIHLNWQLSWPWLSLGNVFANKRSWIQWYEFTGIGGGSLWVLICNVLIKKCYDAWLIQLRKFTIVVSTLIVIVFPIVVSALIQPKKANSKLQGNVVIVQPNVDPYQKFNEANASSQINQLVQLTHQTIDSNTLLTVWPETALSITTLQSAITQNISYQPVFDLVKKYPKNTLVTGIETYTNYGFEKRTKTARKASDGSFYDVFNAAISLHNNDEVSIYNKSKLVPGVESMPTFLNFMSSVFEQFGGTTGGYGRNDSSEVFAASGNPYIVAPVICYESIYGEYVSSYIQKGANIIAIITNDGWWGNTPGHQQHLAYAQLRAIETRRWIARSANTGISAVINNMGEIVVSEKWDTIGTLKIPIPTENRLTFYVKHGDYLYKILSIIGVFLFAMHMYKNVVAKIKLRNVGKK
ncbi:MAG: apolipoprotein N-acyltransferase [Chitinophagaceae bacterium]